MLHEIWLQKVKVVYSYSSSIETRDSHIHHVFLVHIVILYTKLGWLNCWHLLVKRNRMTSGASKIPSASSQTFLFCWRASASHLTLSTVWELSALQGKNFSYAQMLICFELPVSARQVLFRFNCEDILLSERKLGYLLDSETLEIYWEIVNYPHSRCLKEVTAPSPVSTSPY